MRCHHPVAGAVLLAVLALAAFPCSAQTQPASPGADRSAPGASVFFPETAFEFQPVIDGVKVVHDFILMNKGSAELVISNVRTG
jgi:hypothetical protein